MPQEMSLETAPPEIKLAVDLIELLEINRIEPDLALAALAIVQRDYQQKAAQGKQPQPNQGDAMKDPIRFETGRPMLLGGLRRHHAFQSADFGGQWRDFEALGSLPGQLGEHAYGVVCAATRTGCEYMCAVEVASLEALPASLGRMRIDTQTYAVFLHSGNISTIGASWQGALDWLARSDYQSAHKPDFERYGAGFDPRTGDGELEIWLAVQPREVTA